MKTYKISFIPGDGVGQEVSVEAVKILEAVAMKHGLALDIVQYDWGCDYYLENGIMMPEDALETLRECDAIFLGSVGDVRKVPDHISVAIVLDIRKAFDQYVNLRPIKLYPGVETLIKTAAPETVDITVVRENTEGEYSSLGGFFKMGTPDGFAVQSAVFTQKGCERVMRYAFDLARRRKESGSGPGQVTSCTKSNALKYSMVFWDQVFQEVAGRYPDVASNTALVDALAMWLIRNPENYDVIVASNLFGDIITDLGAMLQGGMGLAAGANINPEGKFPSMFEPIHGSAPDIMGKAVVNPVAAIESIRMMLEHLGEGEAALDVQQAVASTLKEGRTRTADMGGTDKTHDVGDAVKKALLEA
ncbi:MAG: 3-isopropylmalate dehydrogenase [Proteobacteria bacterium]|nr:3-isopropylmalate dehydrogenase [Pseudomonadota bacterium]